MFSFSRDNIMLVVVFLCILGVLYIFRDVQKLKQSLQSMFKVPTAHEFVMNSPAPPVAPPVAPVAPAAPPVAPVSRSPVTEPIPENK